MAADPVERKLAAILHADVVGYSRLMAEDEARTVRTLTAYREVVDTLVGRYSGRVVDFRGDDFLAEFPTATDAVQAAIEIQRVIGARNTAVPERNRMQFRIGVHLGEVRVDDQRIYGDGVNIAARLEGLAEPGGICISESVYQQVRNKLSLEVRDLGEQSLKNIPEPIRSYLLLPGEDASKGRGQRPQRPWRLGAAALLGILLVVAAAWWLRSAPSAPLGSEETRPSLAVLPFANLSGDPEQEYFSDGITEDLITDLSKISSLSVAARNSSFTYKNRNAKVDEIGRDLGVRYVLEGSVRKAGDRIRITAQLIDTSSGDHLWAERYDRTLEDIFAVQDDVTGEIVAALALKLTPEERTYVEEQPTRDLEAYDLYLRGIGYQAQITPESAERAQLMYERAIGRDPDFAEAYAMLSSTQLLRWLAQWTSDPQVPARAAAAAARALELDDRLARAHAVSALLRLPSGDWEAILEQARRAVALDPNDTLSQMVLGTILALAGQPEEALGLLESALARDPEFAFSSSILVQIGNAHRMRGDHEQAIASLNRAIHKTPDSAAAHQMLAATYAERGELDKARAESREVLRINPNFALSQLRISFRDPAEYERFRSALQRAGFQ